ncbi:intradiol ring-cleavage dioxygenase [Streptomyces sp. NPDC001927]
MTEPKPKMSRRSLLVLGGAGVTAVGLSGAYLAAATTEGTSAAPASPSGSPSAPNVMPLRKEATEGPYYLDYDKHRVDITEGRRGSPLEVRIRVLNVKDGKPVREAAVDIWQCDALGIYSGYEETSEAMNNGEIEFEGPIPKLPPDSRTTFLRGFQMTDRDGWVRFRTVFPGWYTGRTVHIHVKVHTKGVFLNQAYADGVTVHTGQIYFPEDLTAAVAQVRPYTQNDLPRTTNAKDPFYSGDTPADGLLAVEWNRADATEPIRGSITMAVDLDAINPGRAGNPPPPPNRPFGE